MDVFCIGGVSWNLSSGAVKLGYEKTKFAFMIIIMGACFLIPLLLKKVSSVNLEFLQAFPMVPLYGGLVLISVLILAVSARISVGVYEKADLA